MLPPEIFKAYDIRGVVGRTLTAPFVQTIGRALGSLARERRRDTIVVGRDGHNDTLTFRVELAPGADAGAVRQDLEAATRDVMKLRGGVDVVPAGTIAENVKKIVDERKWD